MTRMKFCLKIESKMRWLLARKLLGCSSWLELVGPRLTCLALLHKALYSQLHLVTFQSLESLVCRLFSVVCIVRNLPILKLEILNCYCSSPYKVTSGWGRGVITAFFSYSSRLVAITQKKRLNWFKVPFQMEKYISFRSNWNMEPLNKS